MPPNAGHKTIKNLIIHPFLEEIKRTGRVAQPEQTGVGTPRERRRYSIVAERFRCGDESGIDWTGSDEVKWSFTTKFEGQETTTNVSSEFGNVDSGDERSFGPGEGEIAPVEGALDDGVAGPVGVSIQLIEVDQGKDLKALVEQAFSAAGFIPTVGQWIAKTPDIVRNHLVEVLEDDLMGSNTIVFQSRDLERRLPVVGSSFTDKLYFGGQGGDLPFAVAGGPDYFLYLTVRRVADAV